MRKPKENEYIEYLFCLSEFQPTLNKIKIGLETYVEGGLEFKYSLDLKSGEAKTQTFQSSTSTYEI